MAKNLYISEKPSVAREFASALKENFKTRDGYMESDKSIITWCVGHLVTMSYPDAYDPKYKKWRQEDLPFIPMDYRYEIIPNVKKQFNIVKDLLKRGDVGTIYVCTDSGREGEYIYRLVDQMAKVPKNKDKRRVWIDSQTEEEILRGIREAKPLSAYDNLSESAYLRAKEDYLMGINFSRILSLKYGYQLNTYLKTKKYSGISVGRVMTCVLGMVVKREMEIREFVKTPFYRVNSGFTYSDQDFDGEFKAVEGSKYFKSPLLYKENGFKELAVAQNFVKELLGGEPNFEETNESGKRTYTHKLEEEKMQALVSSIEKRKERKNPPLLYNLAELQNECSKIFKISPDQTLQVVQDLYEKKLVTYPRTDARVLSSAVSKEIDKNLRGLTKYIYGGEYAKEILEKGTYKKLEKTRYVNDKQITDHYAIIPTGQGLNALNSLNPTSKKVYEVIVRRFLAIFYPPAIYRKISITALIEKESFFSSFKILEDEGYLKIMNNSFQNKVKQANKTSEAEDLRQEDDKKSSNSFDPNLITAINKLKKGMYIDITGFTIKEGETSPPRRYNSGSLILAMENAGQLIEDEELRAQIKGSGIGTSATRAEILNKLTKINYLKLNKKTQIITPTQMGEMIYIIVASSIKSLLNPELTASWEKGLTYVEKGTTTTKEYMKILEDFIARNTNKVKQLNNSGKLNSYFDHIAKYY
ncbi:MAG: type IA DNA topoisomerase [Clostridiales bacterium]|nr:type IA DNA topoisomerase [Clostridiales bacterium]